MTDDAEMYRQYAAECVTFAKNAKTEGERKNFLDMARTWTQAAMQVEDGVTLPLDISQPQPAPTGPPSGME